MYRIKSEDEEKAVRRLGALAKWRRLGGRQEIVRMHNVIMDAAAEAYEKWKEENPDYEIDLGVIKNKRELQEEYDKVSSRRHDNKEELF